MNRLVGWLLGATDPESVANELRQHSVPVADDPCRTCPDPCDEGHDEYPGRLFIENTTNFFGSIQPLRRQVIISTGKYDWPKKIEQESGTLGQLLSAANDRLLKTSKVVTSEAPRTGTFDSSKSARLSILNGSHKTVAHDDDRETVLVFPDFKAVVGARADSADVETLWRHALDPAVGVTGTADDDVQRPLRSYILPYACVILLCSHKRRDNRCGITAPKLEEALRTELTHAGWEVHTELEHLDDVSACIESIHGSDSERERAVQGQLQAAGAQRRALILGVSHVGGHKWAGNVQIFNPQGAGVYYGRVTPHEVPAIVKSTILDGKLLPQILRGAMNVERVPGKTLLDW
ncbi:hypothetical protein EXIGLDRAFT_716103 [Exidia glandulosa HHB12029]|uniref:Sucraseferredoxin-like protein n=1 Tax=Exidia glandulosa HHB12029 TaxID=1314781 RepID=A0A165QUL7_EXIGL|nr:hypothetical protein EXIGLDRAFT_716103 [Exidia glandulosa HHB12029]